MSFNHNVSISQNRLRTSYEIYCTFANIALLVYVHIHSHLHPRKHVCGYECYVHLCGSLGVCGSYHACEQHFQDRLSDTKTQNANCPAYSVDIMKWANTHALNIGQRVILLKCLLGSLIDPVITFKAIQLCLVPTSYVCPF